MPRFPRIRPAAIAALLVAVGAMRMASTFRVFSATSDEATHIGAGLETRYLVDSNIDWGQDILRLRSVARRAHIETLTVSLMGPADYVALGFPPIELASPWTESHGWVAVSDHSYRLTGAEGGWKWLPERYQRVGKSIRLYRIP